MTTIRGILLLIASLGLAVASCGGPAAVDSGIRGQATAGPVCPVEKNPPDPSCAPRPVSGAVVVVRSSGGAEVLRVTTGADGTFQVAVPPGQYVVEGLPATGLMAAPGPQDVTVTAGAPATIVLRYDTGIR
jgi:hypothetical protein